jgi:NodT family efflux transporter outer membrane factor (OMF) lipoprotein
MTKIGHICVLRRVATIAILSLSLFGCTVGPDFVPQKPDLPKDWVATAKPQGSIQAQPGIVTAAPLDAGAWWASFHDPILSSLIERAAASNLDIRTAALRIAEARALRNVAGADQWPSLSGNASYQNQRFSEKTAQGSLFGSLGKLGSGTGLTIPSYPNPYDQFQIGFDASWEPDLFGGVRRSVEAADADAQASVEDANDALVSLEGEVARSYIDLRNAQAHRKITQDNLDTQHEIEVLAREKMRAGLGNDFDVSNAAAQTTTTQSQLPLYNRQIDTDINQLSELLAREPNALQTELQTPAAVPPVPPDVPIGLPADLIRRRADIRAAEARLHAATARVGVAVADLFPRVTLDASFGTQAERFPDLANWASRFINIGPSLQIPIFEGGKLRATVRLQNIREKEAAVAYAKAVLTALHDVENALIEYNTEQSRRQSLQVTLLHNQNVLALARRRYKIGLTAFLDVLDAERTLQQTQLSLADSTAAVSTDLVALYKALGGGWEGQDVGSQLKLQNSAAP